MVVLAQETRGSWVFMVPVSGLVLTDAVKNEITVDRVTFISFEKLRRVRKRFGIRKRVSEFQDSPVLSKFLEAAGRTVAVVRHNGVPNEITNKIIRLVEGELQILATSQLGYARRSLNAFPSIYRNKAPSFNFLCMNTRNDSSVLSSQTTGKIGFLVLDKQWLGWQKDCFFYDLLRIIKGEIGVGKEWRRSLIRVATLVGQSITSTNLSHAFLLNMIAIESLLTRQGDKYTAELPKRIEAFIGWVGYWGQRNYEKRIEEVYQKRCQYVHDGNGDSIDIKDLLFTDDILLNVLVNVIMHIRTFRKKDDVIAFAEKVAAEHVLGIVGEKSKVRPKTLKFLRKKYTKEDYQKI